MKKGKKKTQNHSCPRQNKSLPEANSEAGKTKVHFKVNSGVAQCVNLMKCTGKSQDMSHSHQSIKTLWESTAITLWAKWLSKAIPLKASHRGPLWPSMFSSSFLLFISFFLSFIFFLACALDLPFFLAVSFFFACSFSLPSILSLSSSILFCILSFPPPLNLSAIWNKGLNQGLDVDLRVWSDLEGELWQI